MNISEFESSLVGPSPPDGLNLALQALWYDAQDDWDQAHELAQIKDEDGGAWVHAYLHRKEGDNWNAGYWYRRAGKPHYSGSLKSEWREMVATLLTM